MVDGPIEGMAQPIRPSDFTKGVARIVFCAGLSAPAALPTAGLVLRRLLAAMREPSEAMLRAGAEAMDALDYPATDGDPMFAVECSVGLYGPEALVAWRAMWAAFARTHGLEAPDAG